MTKEDLTEQVEARLGRPLTESEDALVEAMASLAGPVKFYRGREVEALTGIGRAKRAELVSAKLFPSPIPLSGTNIVVWPSDILAVWQAEQRQAAR